MNTAIGKGAACVVGSQGGIGAALVRRLEADGWSPVLQMDLAGPIAIDLTEPASVEAAFEIAKRSTPQLKLLVVTAGMLDLEKLSTLTAERWNRVIAVNLTGPFLCCLAAKDWIGDDGRVVLISSLAARTGGVLTGPSYAASKGGVESLTKSIAQEFAPRRITVNCVAPGGVDTAMLAHNSPESRSAMAEATPLKRAATPEEIAGAIAYLASPDAAFITGTVIPVNGGLRMD
jgi:3-oxoacyl-[acyl-carrier protein] reductase